jgi:peptidoglycan DL-endopeptidase CwlO
MARYPVVPKTALVALVAVAGALASVPAAGALASTPADTLETKVHALEQVIEDYNEVREDLRATRRQQADLARRMRPLERALDARQAQLGMIAATAYRTSGAAPALVVINAESAEDFADRLLVLDRLAAQQNKAITGLNVARERYDTSRRTLDALVSQQIAQERQLAGKKSQIEKDIVQLERMRELSGYTPIRSRISGFVPKFTPDRAGAAVRFAYAQLGKSYRFGAGGPDSYDCSGLTSAAWGRAGVSLPHNSRRQWHAVSPIKRSDLRPGDLVFYYSSIHHVAIYVGGGKMIHAPQHGEPVRMDDVDYQPIHGYGRPR